MASFQGYLFILLCIVPAFSVKTPPMEDYYHAAVVEYSPIKGNDPSDSLMKNAEEYTSLIAAASEHADIVVFPEDGLFFFDFGYTTFIEVPFGSHNISPAEDKNIHPVLQMLSQAAQKNSIYVVVNLHEKYQSGSKTLHYNTNVIFDRNGNIIARYRKTNLFNEPLNVTSSPEHVYFDSDFGVRFGTFTCFDILFNEPSLKIIEKYNVTDILYPTLWFSGLPFFTAVQTQAAWAYATDTNLLAAGSNSVLSANTGSGIYAGKKGPVVYLQSQRNETCILYAKVIKKGKPGRPTGEISPPIRKGPREKLKLWGDPVLTEMKSLLITPDVNISSVEKFQEPSSNDTSIVNSEFSRNICQNGFCCNFFINATFTYRLIKDSSKPSISNPYKYRLAVFNGSQSYSVRNVGVQFCAIISCLNESLASCGKPLEGNSSVIYTKLPVSNFYLDSTVFNKITIKSLSLADDSLTIPDILEFSENPDIFGSLMDVNKFSFGLDNKTAELNFSSDKLITGGLYTRVFPRDEPLTVPVPPSSFIPVSVSVLLIFISLLYYII